MIREGRIHEQAMARSNGGRTRSRRSGALAALALAAAAGCHLVIGVEERSRTPASADAGVEASPGVDSGADAPSLDASEAGDGGCDLQKPFGTPEPLTPLNTVDGEFGATLSTDELEIFYTTTKAGEAVVHRATRAARTLPFTKGEIVAELSGIPAPHWSVSLGPDDRELFVTATSPPRALFRAVRPSRGAAFGGSQLLPLEAPDASDLAEEQVFAAASGQIYVGVQLGPQLDLYVAPRADAGGNSPLVPLFFFNTPASSEAWPVQSHDGLTFYYSSGDGTSEEILQAKRSTVDVPFPAGAALSFPAVARKHPLWLSPDGCRLYLSQENAPGGRGGADLFVASRPP